jgi:hypothetical protein
MLQQLKDPFVVPAWVAKFNGNAKFAGQLIEEIREAWVVIGELGGELDEEDAAFPAEMRQPTLNPRQPLLRGVELLAVREAAWGFDGKEKVIG